MPENTNAGTPPTGQGSSSDRAKLYRIQRNFFIKKLKTAAVDKYHWLRDDDIMYVVPGQDPIPLPKNDYSTAYYYPDPHWVRYLFNGTIRLRRLKTAILNDMHNLIPVGQKFIWNDRLASNGNWFETFPPNPADPAIDVFENGWIHRSGNPMFHQVLASPGPGYPDAYVMQCDKDETPSS